MPESKNKNFSARIIDVSTKRALPEFEVGTENFLITRNDVEFQVEVKSKNKNVIYGAKMWVDGQEVGPVKRFKSIGHFFGFRSNYGSYQYFSFTQSIADNTPKPVLEEGEIPTKPDKTHEVNYFSSFFLRINFFLKWHLESLQGVKEGEIRNDKAGDIQYSEEDNKGENIAEESESNKREWV